MCTLNANFLEGHICSYKRNHKLLNIRILKHLLYEELVLLNQIMRNNTNRNETEYSLPKKEQFTIL